MRRLRLRQPHVDIKLSVDLEAWTFVVHVLGPDGAEVSQSSMPIPDVLTLQLRVRGRPQVIDLGSAKLELPKELFKAIDEEINRASKN